MLALAGAVLYAALVPGHIVSQATSRAAAAAETAPVAQTANPICHEGPGAADENVPTLPKKKCPFCIGYAAFQAATVGGTDTGVLPGETVHIAFGTLDSVFAGALTGLPQSRAPPFEL